MRVKYSKTIQERQFEPLQFEIELDDSDVPTWDTETVQAHARRMEFEAERRLTIFLARKDRLTVKQAIEHITNLRAMLEEEDSLYESVDS